MKTSALLCLFGAIQAVQNSRTRRNMLDDDPCLDTNQVESSEVFVSSRYKELSMPWNREDLHAKIYTSPGIQYQWSWVESLPIRGLTPSTTMGDVIRWLDGKNCTFLAVGPSVWQTVLKGKPIVISGETSCSLEMLYSWCVKKFSPPSCGLYPLENAGSGAYRLEIGDARTNSSIEELRAEPLQLFEWGSTLNKSPEKWGYSVDAMSIYDNQMGQVYLMDLSGRGYNDICEKRISPAVEEGDWKKWADAPVSKMLQYYELRSQGFSPANHDFEKFVNKLIEEKANKKSIQTFYCESILGGVVNWAGNELITACHVVFPENRKRIQATQSIMAHEMGEIYESKIKPAISEMEAVYLTAKQYIDVRNRLKHRIQSPHPKPDEPNLVLGEPLVGDISEVHRRPILSKSEAINELPKDFPSGPKASPDENGIFKEQEHQSLTNVLHEPEVAGGGFQHETYGPTEDDDDEHEEEDPGQMHLESYPQQRHFTTKSAVTLFSHLFFFLFSLLFYV